MQYYHDLVTERSFELLRSLRKKYKFILIGGWAVFLYTKSLKSKDIDIIIDYEDLSLMKKDFEIRKNRRLKKYEIQTEGIDIDIYLPYFSELGLPCQEIKKLTLNKEGFIVPIPEVLLVLKQFAFIERQGTPKGRKDKIDIFSLLLLENFDFSRYKNLVKEYHHEELLEYLKKLIKETFEVKELRLSRYQMSRFKKRVLQEITLEGK